MIWRSWVRTLVRPNLGFVVLLSNLYLDKKQLLVWKISDSFCLYTTYYLSSSCTTHTHNYTTPWRQKYLLPLSVLLVAGYVSRLLRIDKWLSRLNGNQFLSEGVGSNPTTILCCERNPAFSEECDWITCLSALTIIRRSVRPPPCASMTSQSKRESILWTMSSESVTLPPR